MTRNVDEVKKRFIELCEEYDIKEVWVNFENPFGVEHDERGAMAFLVPNNFVDGSGDQGCGKFEILFSPKLDSDDEEILASSGFGVYLAPEDSRRRRKLARDVRADITYKLLYSKEGGVRFG